MERVVYIHQNTDDLQLEHSRPIKLTLMLAKSVEFVPDTKYCGDTQNNFARHFTVII
jgi:hypothetical protein